MDVGWFLQQRVEFIRQLYATSTAPYVERQRLIEAEEPPYEPPYSEDGEPAFQTEYAEANDSIHVLGYSCVSMLSGTLQAFFETWKRLLCLQADPDTKKAFNVGGMLNGYHALFKNTLGVRLEESGVDLKLLEEVVLVRNTVQHRHSLSFVRPNHSQSAMRRLEIPFFLDEHEIERLCDKDRLLHEDEEEEKDHEWSTNPLVAVTSVQMNSVLDAVVKLASWMDSVLEPIRTGKNTGMPDNI